MAHSANEVLEKTLEPVLVAGIRIKGRYSDCGKGFAKIGRSLGRYICGKPLMLHYDTEYHEDDADFEACFPVRQAKAVDGISVRELQGGRCVSLVHRGPYEQLGPAYATIFEYINRKKYKTSLPTRGLRERAWHDLQGKSQELPDRDSNLDRRRSAVGLIGDYSHHRQRRASRIR